MNALDFRKLFKLRNPPTKGYCILTLASLFLAKSIAVIRYGASKRRRSGWNCHPSPHYPPISVH
jgi:hypothetical protein